MKSVEVPVVFRATEKMKSVEVPVLISFFSYGAS